MFLVASKNGQVRGVTSAKARFRVVPPFEMYGLSVRIASSGRADFNVVSFLTFQLDDACAARTVDDDGGIVICVLEIANSPIHSRRKIVLIAVRQRQIVAWSDV